MKVVYSSEKKKSIIKNAAIVFVLLMLVLTFLSKTIDNLLIPEVEYDKPTQGTLSTKIEAAGEIVSSDIEKITSAGEWSVLEVLVKENLVVEPGDVLATVDIDKLMLESKKKNFEIKKLENALGKYKLEFEDEDLYNNEQDVKTSAKEIVRLTEKLTSMKELYEIGAETLNSVKELELQLENAREEYSRSIRNLDIKKAAIGNRKKVYDKTVEGLNLEIEIKKDELNAFNKDIPAKGKIISKLKGVVISVNVSEGNKTRQDQLLFEIIPENAKYIVQWKLNAIKASLLKIQDNVVCTPEGVAALNYGCTIIGKRYLSEEGSYMFSAEITAEVKNVEFGQKANVVFLSPSVPYTCIVPSNSIKAIGTDKVVFMLKKRDGIFGEENYVELVKVNVLDQDDFYTAVSSTKLQDESLIITNTTKPLSNNTQVKVR